MSYEGFNFIDYLLHGAKIPLDNAINNRIKQSGGNPETVHALSAAAIYFVAKSILSDYINGKEHSFSYELYPISISCLKLLVLTIQDNDVKNKVSTFLATPSTATANDAIEELSKSEIKHFSQKAAEKAVEPDKNI